jgi:hypothetical protein
MLKSRVKTPFIGLAALHNLSVPKVNFFSKLSRACAAAHRSAAAFLSVTPKYVTQNVQRLFHTSRLFLDTLLAAL